jgi:hypothetical protein
VPCKREFPNLVKLQKTHAKDGFVAISVTVDAAKDKPNAVAFLEKMKATDLVNLHLDEVPDVWRSKFTILGPPAVYVFDQENRIALKMPAGDEGVDYEVITKKVQELLKK